MPLEETRLGYDVVIIGAGPAGCSAARSLSRKFSVLLIDSKPLPRNKACGGILTQEAADLILPLKPPEKIFSRPKKMRINYFDFETGGEAVSEEEFYNVERKEFDSWMLSWVEKNNVSVCEKTTLIDFSQLNKSGMISLVLESNGHIRQLMTKHIIGCGGALSGVRKKIGFTKVPYYLGMQEYMRGCNLTNTIFIRDTEVTDFYCWLIPKGSRVLIGGGILPHDANKKFALFKKKISKKYNLKGTGDLLPGVALRPASLSEIFLGRGDVLLAGEAAGLISPSSCEGISFALQSGRFAAEAINDSPSNPLPLYKSKCKVLVDRLRSKFAKPPGIQK